MLMRVPVVNRDQLQALRSLLRLDFTRCLRNTLINTTVVPQQCLNILQLTDVMSQAEQPLIVVAALMQYHGTPTAMLPLDAGRFNLFSKLLAIPLGSADFPGIAEDQLEPILAPMKAYIAELKTIFESSAFIDEEQLKNKMKTATPKSDMMN